MGCPTERLPVLSGKLMQYLLALMDSFHSVLLSRGAFSLPGDHAKKRSLGHWLLYCELGGQGELVEAAEQNRNSLMKRIAHHEGSKGGQTLNNY